MQPTISTRLTSPKLLNGKYTVDVEFKTDTPGATLDGVNFRFFYDSADFTLATKLKGFVPGYAVNTISPFFIGTGNAASKDLFGFKKAATYVSGVVEFLYSSKTAPVLSTTAWTKLFQIELTVRAGASILKPAIVLDKKLPSSTGEDMGSFLRGSGGLTIIVYLPGDPTTSMTKQLAEQFNWVYFSNVVSKYGPFGKVV